jgi:hypothetical protein
MGMEFAIRDSYWTSPQDSLIKEGPGFLSSLGFRFVSGKRKRDVELTNDDR